VDGIFTLGRVAKCILNEHYLTTYRDGAFYMTVRAACAKSVDMFCLLPPEGFEGFATAVARNDLRYTVPFL
jgi:hypothetical protein